MSVIAWDGKTLSADRQSTNAEMRVSVSKMRKTDDAIIAWTGAYEYGLLLAQWYIDGAQTDKWPAFQRTDKWCRLVVATKQGVVEYEQEPVAQPVSAEFFAWGAGRDFAMGALAMGATAQQAVEIASRFNVYCGVGIESHEFAVDRA